MSGYYFDPDQSNRCCINRHTRCPNCRKVFHYDTDPTYPVKPVRVYWNYGGYCSGI